MAKRIPVLIFCLMLFACSNDSVGTGTKNTGTTGQDPAQQEIDTGTFSHIQDTSLVELTFTGNNNIDFAEISETDFNHCKPANHLVFPATKKKNGKFMITTKTGEKQFKNQEQSPEEGTNGWLFLGYYPAFKLYAVSNTSTAESLNFSDLFLLDSITGYSYQLPSFNDGHGEMPLPSVNNKRLLYYSNETYGHKNSDILILEVNDRNKPATYLEGTHYYHSNDFAVEAVCWTTDNIFLVKGFEEVYENEKWVKKYKYYEGKLK